MSLTGSLPAARGEQGEDEEEEEEVAFLGNDSSGGRYSKAVDNEFHHPEEAHRYWFVVKVGIKRGRDVGRNPNCGKVDTDALYA